MKLEQVILRGTRASQPAAGAGNNGWLYCVTDENNIVERSNGAAWQAFGVTFAGTNVRTIAIVLDGAGATITTGVKLDVAIPFACTIAEVTLLADQSGSIVVDIWKDTYANYPPTVADSITASAKPTISGATKSQDSTLTGWTKTINAGDTLRFNVDSCATIQRCTLVLKVTT